MRPELLNPVGNKRKLKRAIELAEQIYDLHEAGKDYTRERAELSTHVGQPILAKDVDAAFGTCKPKEFAVGLLPAAVPMDLTTEEMLDMIHRIYKVIGTSSQHVFWLRCLEANTKDDQISDLIFWPNEYFWDDNVHRELTPQQILDIALASVRKPPISSGDRVRMRITVLGRENEEFAADEEVATNGTVEVPKLGRIEVAGMTPSEARKVLPSLYKKAGLKHVVVGVMRVGDVAPPALP